MIVHNIMPSFFVKYALDCWFLCWLLRIPPGKWLININLPMCWDTSRTKIITGLRMTKDYLEYPSSNSSKEVIPQIFQTPLIMDTSTVKHR